MLIVSTTQHPQNLVPIMAVLGHTIQLQSGYLLCKDSLGYYNLCPTLIEGDENA